MRFNNWFLLTFLLIDFFLPKVSFSEANLQRYGIHGESSRKAPPGMVLQEPTTRIDSELLDAQDFAEDSNIDKKSIWYKKIEYRLGKGKEFEKNLYKNKNVLFKIESKEKLNDINFVNRKPITTPTPVKINTSKEEQEKFSKEMKKQIDEFYTPPTIPPCKETKKEILPNPVSDEIKLDEKKDGYIFFDSLLLSENIKKNLGEKQILNKDFFGKKNQLEFYSSKPYDFDSLKLKKSDIKCLPFRLIVTKQKIIKIYGEDALKNYDLKREGEFHWKVKKNKNRFFD